MDMPQKLAAMRQQSGMAGKLNTMRPRPMRPRPPRSPMGERRPMPLVPDTSKRAQAIRAALIEKVSQGGKFR